MRRVLGIVIVVLLVAGVVPASAAIHLGLTDRGRPQDVIDARLAERLATAAPTEPLTVFVHAAAEHDGAGAKPASDAARNAGLAIVTEWDRVGVTVAVGVPDAIRRAAADDAVSRIEVDEPLEWDLDAAHAATRFADIRHGFAYEVKEPDPTETTRRQVRTCDGKRDRRGRRACRTRTVEETRTIPGKTRTEQAPPTDGTGVTIAMVDTGIDGTHPMFKDGKLVRSLMVACPDMRGLTCDGNVVSGRGSHYAGDTHDELFVDTTYSDSDTHGTYTAGIAAGNDVTTADGMRLHGAAPGAKLVMLGTGGAVGLLGAAGGLNWVLEHHRQPCGPDVPAATCPPIRVVSNSWGGGHGSQLPATTIVKLVEALVRDGVVVVFSAGNEGGGGSVARTNPWAWIPLPGVIVTASYDDGGTGSRDGRISGFSSRGKAGEYRGYPDIAAPGHMTSACSLACYHRQLLPQPTTDTRYMAAAGTSAAAPVIAGTVALVLQANPRLTPAEVEDVIEDTAHKLAAGAPYEPDPRNPGSTTSFDKGHGLVDVAAAVARAYGVPAPRAAATVACRGEGELLRDRIGDSPRGNLDIDHAAAQWDATAGKLTFVVKLRDLAEDYGENTTELRYTLDIVFGGRRLAVEVVREWIDTVPNGVRVELRQAATGEVLATDAYGGTYDLATDVVTGTITQQLIDAANATLATSGAAPIPALAPGLTIADAALTTAAFARAIRIGAPLAGEDASGACRFVLGAGSAAPAAAAALPDPETSAPDSAAATSTAARVSLGVGSPEFRWSAGPFTAIADVTSGTCADAADANCDRVPIHLDIPATGGLVEILVTSDAVGVHDFDVALVDPAGRVVERSVTRPLSPDDHWSVDGERVFVDVHRPGVYTVLVTAHQALNASYAGSVRLSATG